MNPKVSVIIPTHNRPELLTRAVRSVLMQTYPDFELIIVDDGDVSAREAVDAFSDQRIKYLKHEPSNQGGSAARNTGIKNCSGVLVAFLDDDDEWLPEKLEIQVRELGDTSEDIGFSFSAVVNIYDDHEESRHIVEGIHNYLERALKRFNGFLTSTLLIKKGVFNTVGYFDEHFPSHQDPDLVIRMSHHYKGIGIGKPLVRMSMSKRHGHIGTSLKNKIAGREMILEKHAQEFQSRLKLYAQHLYWLGLLYRDDGNFEKARGRFYQAWKLHPRFQYLVSYVSLFFNGKMYKLFRKPRLL